MSEQQVAVPGLTLPDHLRSERFKPVAFRALQVALERGTISTREIAFCLPKGKARDREGLQAVIGWFSELFKNRDVRIIPDKEEVAHRTQFPLPEEERLIPTRRPKFDDPSRPIALPLQYLEERGSEYEYDVLGRYYAEINQYKLLSAEEEIQLSKRIREEHDLDARNELIVHNLRLVRWMASRYAWSKLDFGDLIQEGNMGLIIAASRFDYRFGNKFATYALWWIRQSISRAIAEQGDVIRLPGYLHDLRRKILKISGEVAEETGDIPDAEQIAQRANLPPVTVQRALLAMRLSVIFIDDPAYVNGHRGEGSDGTEVSVGEVIPDQRILRQDLRIQAKEELDAAQARVNELLETITHELGLSERNEMIFRTFYGFDGSGKRRTLESVGSQFSITRERVRQILWDIWQKIDEQGLAMSHEKLIEETTRIERLEKLVAQTTKQ